ncbi:hypothetical protein D1AOALGA4SA_11662 [Olavius algarvensis Delta 1 endosymbiont]|nr:hypothetical protein D1AOALGA4SA_11662 [Olavius algarvensis Delta 1 endosymbiont]
MRIGKIDGIKVITILKYVYNFEHSIANKHTKSAMLIKK